MSENQSNADRVAQERASALVAQFGKVSDPLGILAQGLVSHHSGKVADEALPVYAFLYKWSIVLNDPELAEYAGRLQRMTSFASDVKPIVEAISGISLFKFLRGIDLKGGGK